MSSRSEKATFLTRAFQGRDIALPLIAGFALTKLLFHLVTSSGYGYFRDELYYLASTEHLAWGYVDHPPLSIFFLWMTRGLLGDSLLAVRLVPAVLGAATVGLTGLMARGLGGGRWACALAMTGALVAPVCLALNHFYSMNAFDLFIWALAAYLMIRIIREGEPRLWIALGAVLGVGLLNKVSVLWLGVGLLVGLIAGHERAWLRTRWPWMAGTIAATMFAPNILWQMSHEWPTLEFVRNATSQKMVTVAPIDFLFGQIDMMLPATLPLWLTGLLFLLLHPAGRKYRPLAWVYISVFAILVLSGSSRSNYLAAAYPPLFAAGGVAIAKLRDRRSWKWVVPALLIAMLGMGVVAAPLAVPLLPVDVYLGYAEALGQQPSTEERKELGQLGQFYADMHGWQEITETVAQVHGNLSESERARARVLAPDYGVAGAVDLFGRRLGLAPALSGHNSYWMWGPGDWDGSVLIVVGGTEEQVGAAFGQVERAATIDCGLCMPYEDGRPVWVVRNLVRPVEEIWPQLKHYD